MALSSPGNTIKKTGQIGIPRIHNDVAFGRLCSMLHGSLLDYQTIGHRFGISRQRVGQIAAQLGIDGRRRQRQRTVRSLCFSHNYGYPADVRGVVREIERQGLKVLPYRQLKPSNGYLGFTWKKTFLIDGVRCHIHCGNAAHKTRPTGRQYVRFHISETTKKAKVSIFALSSRRKIKLYVIPTRELGRIDVLSVPAEGRYAPVSNKKPKRDWTVYEEAWHLLRRPRANRKRTTSRVPVDGFQNL